jgi:hypothetical protein
MLAEPHAALEAALLIDRRVGREDALEGGLDVVVAVHGPEATTSTLGPFLRAFEGKEV